MTHEEILKALDGRTIAVNEQQYNRGKKGYEPTIKHYRLALQKNFNWNWLTSANEDTGAKSLKAVQIENPAVQFDTHLISHANDFAHHFGIIDETHQVSERTENLSRIDFYQSQRPHINQNSIA